ncbi:hypothetical protein [Allopusillimonas ginsengisoli]|uniref:hypothetical protein n=1 Tax=Allopusillimonas ginsengisoli TaxID=453575 RepID=UPI00101FAAF0|nr:hypothetical protein [Allopusillimonas ginsengisoli]TEA79244.1 hypothetical protein ERE07_07665 [Allopusillimonas ginsengisoli]
MSQLHCDITTYAWLDNDSVGFPSGHLQSLKLFKESVVQPSLRALDAEITKFQGSDEPLADFFADEYAELFQTTIEGYVIAVQSMWERGLRAMLIRRDKKLTKFPQPQTLERATWGGRASSLQDHFLRLMGVPLHAFDSYSDLDLLQNLGNAIRHGDGAAARKVHELCPNLWFNWLAPGTEIMAGPFHFVTSQDGPKNPPFASITLPERVLEQMIQSVMWFWEDIECMRCNSFKRKSRSVVTKISAWQAGRAHRSCSRVWHPVDGAFPRGAA